MNDGWIKLHRKTLLNELWRHDKTAFNLFQTILMLVDSKSGTWSGGRFQLCEAYGDIKPSTLYKALKRLEKAKMVTLDSNTKWSRISICKWLDYQSVGNTKREQQSNNKVTTKEQQSNTLTRSKKVRSKNNTKVLGETPTYGNPEINDLFSKWSEIIGYEIASNKQNNRNACNNLLKKHGKDKLEQLLRGVALSQTDKYAPRISDFVSLQSKLSELLSWGKRQSSTKVKGIITI